MIDFMQYMHRDPGICGGVPVFKGTRIPLRVVLVNLAHGHSPAELLRQFPTLRPEHIEAAIAFAAKSSLDDIPRSEVPKVA